MIKAAAIKWRGQVYSIPRPGRHGHVFAYMAEIHPDAKTFGEEEQGFITEENVFVDRIEAAKIAIEHEQIIYPLKELGQIAEKKETQELNWPPLLYSEDLW